MKRPTMAVVLAVAVVTSGTAGWVASATIRSPAELAARTKPPVASTILAPVEQRALATKVVTRGTARFGRPVQLSLTQSALKAQPGVVSQIRGPGRELSEGEVALVESGRPVFVIEGPFPAFRDLGPGVRGDDVRQVQRALIRLGFFRGHPSGVFDAATEAAVSRWYSKAGFAPFRATADQLAEIRMRESDLLAARLEVLSTDDSLGAADSDVVAARSGLDEARRTVARVTVDLAAARAWARATNRAVAAEVRARRVALRAVHTGTMGTPAEIAAADAELDAARADEIDIHESGAAAVLESSNELARLTAAVVDARAELADTIAVGEANVAAAAAALDEVLADPDAPPSTVAAARAELTRVQAEAAAAVRAARAAVGEAERAEETGHVRREAVRITTASGDHAASSRTAAAKAARDAVAEGSRGTASEVAAAASELAAAKTAAVTARREAARRVAEARLAADIADIAVSPARAALSQVARTRANAVDARMLRQRNAQLAATDLGTAQRKAGVQIPVDEIVVVPSAPIRVSEALVAPGALGDGPVLTVTNSTVAVDGTLALNEAKLVKKGMAVQLEEPDLGITAEGRVSYVASTPGTRGADGFHVYFEVLVNGNPRSLPGVSVRISVPIKTSGHELLVVPVTALSLAPDGSSRVQVDRGGTLESVTVLPGLVADGYVAVTAEGGRLAAGDQVTVGTEAAPGG